MPIIGNVILSSCNSSSKVEKLTFEKIYNKDSSRVEKGVKINGKKTGLWIILTETGFLVDETYYLNDKIEGTYIMEEDDGSIGRIEHYHEGLLDGYYENRTEGRLDAKGYYKKGKMDGKWEFYYFGKLARKVEFKNGEPIKVEEIIKMPESPIMP